MTRPEFDPSAPDQTIRLGGRMHGKSMPVDPMPVPEVRRHPMTGELCVYLELTFPAGYSTGPTSVGRYMSPIEAHRLATQLVGIAADLLDVAPE